jgi:hypothetical protein
LQESSDHHTRSSANDSDESLASESEIIAIQNFEDMGRALSEFGNIRVSARFHEELEVFVKMTELEQRVQLSGELPTVSEYLKRRMGSSGVLVCLALTE